MPDKTDDWLRALGAQDALKEEALEAAEAKPPEPAPLVLDGPPADSPFYPEYFLRAIRKLKEGGA